MDGYIGQIIMFSGNFAPRDWEFCNGQSLPVQQYQALFSIIGTTYGGNGQTTFNLPDLRGRVPVGAGQGAGLSNHILGQNGGAETVTLNASQIPAHSHAIAANSGSADKASPIGNYPATQGDSRAGVNAYSAAQNGVMAAGMCSTTGGNQAHANMPPFLNLNFIICVNGMYPDRP